jgi:hypothetical protein
MFQLCTLASSTRLTLIPAGGLVVTSASSFQDVSTLSIMHRINIYILTLLILFCELAMLPRVRCGGVSVVCAGLLLIVGRAETKSFWL